MRKLVLYTLLSLDGVAEEPGDWMFDVDQEIFDNLSRVIETQDDVVLGRGTYDYWVDYWPTSDVEPFATFINATPKHVISSTGSPLTWSNARFVNASPTQYVAALKREPGKDIGVHGSITLAQTLLRADLVDDLRLVIAPTLAGRGRRLFDSSDSLRRLQLLDATRTSAGNLLLAYQTAEAIAHG